MSNILTTRELDLYREAAKAQLQTDPTGTPAAMLAVLEAADLAQKYVRYSHVVGSLKGTYLLKDGIGGGVVSLDTLTSGGTDYTVAQDLPISESGSDGVGASATVATIASGVVSLDTLTSGGTDYTVGQDLPISESGSAGVGASATVATIDGGTGEILTIDVVGGTGYDTPVLDLTAGTVDAVISLKTHDGEILTVAVVGGESYDTPVLDLTAGTIDAVISLQATTYGAYDDVTTLDDMLALI